MITFLILAFRSEWLKRRRSFATALIVGGSLFTPTIVTIIRLTQFRRLPALYASEGFWPGLWASSWESMAIFFLPLGAILATSLMTHLEFRSNGWKQLHALPITSAVIFISKLAVILVMLVEFILLFNAGIYLSGMLPYLLVTAVPHPRGAFTSLPLAGENLRYFVSTLPIVAAQYLVALRSSNVLVPIGVGFMAWVGALAAISSRASFWWPYSYTILEFLKDKPKGAHLGNAIALPWLALASFVVLTIAGYVLFLSKAEKG